MYIYGKGVREWGQGRGRGDGVMVRPCRFQLRRGSRPSPPAPPPDPQRASERESERASERIS
jgi:hypothetical protein